MHDRSSRRPSDQRERRAAPAQDSPGALLTLQHAAGNRAVARLATALADGRPPALRLARTPPVKGGVETKVVSPAVRKLLEAKGLPFATEVTFELLDAKGRVVLEGRFDVVFRSRASQQLIFPELKGDRLHALTKGQKVYVPLFESADGAQVRITGRKGGHLNLPVGHVERVHGQNFFRVGSANLTDFTGFVEHAASGKTPTNVYYDRGKLLAFHSQADFDEFLVKEKGLAVERPAAPKPKGGAVDKPLKPPKPPAVEPPNPLHDPPGGRRPSAKPSTAPTAKGTLFSFGVGLLLSGLHQAAKERRIAEAAKASDSGYVPPGTYSGGATGALERAGDVLHDPFRTGEQSVSLRSRLDMPTFRRFARSHFGTTTAGDMRIWRWDYIFNDTTVRRWLVYVLSTRGRWHHVLMAPSREGAEYWGRFLVPARAAIAQSPERYDQLPEDRVSRYTPDINVILDPTTTDDQVWGALTYTPPGEGDIV
jgi:hypothetical protein